MIRYLNRTTQILIDVGVLSIGLWIAFFTRFDWSPPPQMFKRLMFLWPYVVVFQYVVLAGFGVPRFSWRYVGLREINRIFLATATAATVLFVVRVAAARMLEQIPHAQYALIPLGVILIDFAAVFLGISGTRILRRLVAERARNRVRGTTQAEAVPIILIGAGQAGLIVAKELAHRLDLGLRPVGFLDDDPAKQGTDLHGLRVLGPVKALEKICSRYELSEALITIANAPGKEIRRINDHCKQVGVTTKIIPGIYEIVGGRVNLSRIRELDIEDLLGREPVDLDEDSVSEQVRGRVVVVTGAGGSIGSELCRQVCRFEPARIVLVERAENALFEIHRELVARFESVPIEACVADVSDAQRIDAVFSRWAPQVVIHAAAHKHVPMMEMNPQEAIKNNCLGTRVLADLACTHNVDAFVMISTDKAINPTSVMGASKRIAEIYVQALSRRSSTRFVTVRFGNVLGSQGSVVPIFKQQIERGGPVTVTDAEMTRYFMTIPEASQLVLQAGTMGRGGEIFILDMGEPVKIVDLANDLIALSGYVAGEDIEIEFTGVRQGEKLFEELSVSAESAGKTRHPKIFVGNGRPQDLDTVLGHFATLEEFARTEDTIGLIDFMAEVAPEFSPSSRQTPARAPSQPSQASSPSVSGPGSLSPLVTSASDA